MVLYSLLFCSNQEQSAGIGLYCFYIVSTNLPAFRINSAGTELFTARSATTASTRVIVTLELNGFAQIVRVGIDLKISKPSTHDGPSFSLTSSTAAEIIKVIPGSLDFYYVEGIV